MDYDVVAAAAASPWPLPPPPVHRPPVRRAAGPAAVDATSAERPLAAVPAPRHVQYSFHEDLRVLIIRVVDDQTGDLVREYPARQVLDLVADVMTRMRAREMRDN